MKKLIWIIPLLIVAAALFLTSCSSGVSVNTWPGVANAKDVAYLANGSYIYAVTSKETAESWRYPSAADSTRVFYSAPAVSGDLIVVGSWYPTKVNKVDHYGLYAIDTTGKEVWSQPFLQATGRWIASPVICGDTIFAVNADQTVYALDLKGNLISTFTKDDYSKSGEKNTKLYSKVAYWSQPVCDASNTNVFVGSLNHTLYAFSLKNSRLEMSWEQSLDAALTASPVVREDGKILIGNINGEFYLLNATNGSIINKAQLQGGIWAKPAIKDGNIYIGTQSGNAYKLSENLNILAGPIVLDGAILSKGNVTDSGVLFLTDAGSIWNIGFDGKLTTDTPLKQLGSGRFYSDAVLVSFKDVDSNNNVVDRYKLMAAITQGSELLYSYNPVTNASTAFTPAK
jgi:outer membrane protein assembly factor BamB